LVVCKVKIGDLAITKEDMGMDPYCKYTSGEVVQITEVRYKKDGFTCKNYLVVYQDGKEGCWTRWELKRLK